MVTKHVSVAELRANLSDLIGTVYYGKEPVIVERKGKPMAVLISPEQYERYEQQVMERVRHTVKDLQRLNAEIDPAVEVVTPFEDTHFGTREMTVRDPDGRIWSLQAPVKS